MHLKHALVSALILSSSIGLVACQTPQSNVVSPQNASKQVFAKDMDTGRMMQHLQALESIAKNNGGNRAVGTAGGQASAKYIVEQLKKSGLTAQVIPFENRSKKVGQNIIVEIKGQSKDSAMILGGHYDSVPAGPGINDNGSGVALLLELADTLAHQKTTPKHTLYMAFWDSEEDGIGGSSHFVKGLTEKQLNGIQAYINLDMVGTKNPTIQIADGDQSSIDDMEKTFKERGMNESDYKPITDALRGVPNHKGDIALENHLRDFFATQKITIKDDSSTLTASDTLPFMGKVPVTSLILFNEQMKGDVLEFAPCYHQSCDTIEQVDPESLKIAYDAVQYVLDEI